jgi:hypothetical protein
LAALNQVFVVDDDRRNGLDTLLPVELLALTNLVCVGACFQNLAGARGIKAGLRRDIDQHLAIARVAALGEVGCEKSLLQRILSPFKLRPMQQPMRIERVVDARAFFRVEREPERLSAQADGFLVARELLGRRAVLLSDVLGNILPFRGHVRIELERLKVNVDARSVVDARERLLERAQSDHAPWTGDIGHEVDFQLG